MSALEGWTFEPGPPPAAWNEYIGFLELWNGDVEIVSMEPTVRPIVHVPVAVLRRFLEMCPK